MKHGSTPIDRLIPYARNARMHSEAQVAQIAASIREFGFCNPVLIDADGGIIAGHGRVMAARKLGLDEVPTITLDHLTETQKRAYIIADNRLAETGGGWDQELLALEMEDLRLEEFDLNMTGFDAEALDALMDQMARTDAHADDSLPEDFKEVDEGIDTDHECPKCGYRWSGGG
jgi:ParB-like chromosome segregation protein Spo0J